MLDNFGSYHFQFAIFLIHTQRRLDNWVKPPNDPNLPLCRRRRLLKPIGVLQCCWLLHNFSSNWKICNINSNPRQFVIKYKGKYRDINRTLPIESNWPAQRSGGAKNNRKKDKVLPSELMRSACASTSGGSGSGSGSPVHGIKSHATSSLFWSNEQTDGRWGSNS